MLELETGTNYSEDNAHEVEKDDNDCDCCRICRVWQESRRIVLGKGTAENETESRTEITIVSRLQDVKSAIETLRKVSDECKIQEDEFDFFGKSLAVQSKKEPLQRALICQQNLQQVMMDERTYQSNEGTRHTSSPVATSSCYLSVSSPYSAHTPPRGSTVHPSPSYGLLKWCHWLIFLMLYSFSFLYNEIIVPANWFFKLQH